MRRRAVVLGIIAFAVLTLAAVLLRLAQAPDKGELTGELTIYGSTDDVAFRPVLDDFRLLHPGVGISYVELGTHELNSRFLAEAAGGQPRADLLLSSAMDLQAKLVNDGFAMRPGSVNVSGLPSWAQWRGEAFGFTFEPCVLVFNAALMKGRELPDSRFELIEAIKHDPAFWNRRIGLYDITRSSVGYLLASQEVRQSSHFGTLTEVLGSTHPSLMRNTSDILAAVKSGRLAMGYGVLGSYAQEEIDKGAPLTIVFPQDFTLALSRTAIIPFNAPHPRAAKAFLEYLLSVRGQTVMSTRSRLNSIRNEVPGHFEFNRNDEVRVGIIRPIALGPGLLAYLDQQKEERLLLNWRVSMGEMGNPLGRLRGSEAGTAQGSEVENEH